MLLVFGAELSEQAYPIPVLGLTYDSEAVYLGRTLDLEDYYGITAPTKGVHKANLDNIKKVIELYNSNNSTSYFSPTSFAEPVEKGYPINLLSGTITLDGNTAYLTMKWNLTFGLWDVSGITDSGFDFSGLDKGLSSYRTIPDASAALLLGSAFVIYGIFIRKSKRS